MLSKNRIKQIRSLHTKKGREKENLFIAEGIKIINELIKEDTEIVIDEIIAREDVITELNRSDITTAPEEQIKQISALSNNQGAVAICRLNRRDVKIGQIKGKTVLALDRVQDPGNLGTIIRLADWFNIKQIICSKDCADLYNPKVIQSTMGAFSRVTVVYTDLEAFIKRCREEEIPTYGTFLDGDNIYKENYSDGIIVMGNEGSGISAEIEKLISNRITIPTLNSNGSESLNVAIATSITCSTLLKNRFI